MGSTHNVYKVCHLTTLHPAFDTRIFYKQAKSLSKAGYDVTLIAQHDKDETVDGVKIISLPKPRNRFQRMIKLAFQTLRFAFKEKASVYHFHDPELIPVGLFLKLFGAKVIYDAHEDYPASIRTRDWLPAFMRNIIAYVFDFFERISPCVFDAVITVTEDISKRFRSGKVVILHNYPILRYVADKVSPKLFRIGYTVIYVGVLSKERGIREIVQSLEYIDEKFQVKLKTVGKFDDVDFEKEIRAMAVFSKVDFVGLVPHEEVYFHLSTADIGLICFHPVKRYQAALSTKLFEYLAVELPVIISDFPLWKEFVDKNQCGITVDSRNPKEIAKGIEFLLQHPQLMREMGENGRKTVMQKHYWNSEERKLLKVYEEITQCSITTKF